MMFGYLGKDKLNFKGEWIRNIRDEDLGKYVIGQYQKDGSTNNYCVGNLQKSAGIAYCGSMYLQRYKIISKELYEALKE